MKNEVIEKDTNLQSKLDLIKRTVAKGATNDEFSMFMHLAKSYQLDPINKEIWFIKYKDNKGEERTTITTSRDGYLAIANRNEHFQGMLSDVVHKNDEFEKMSDGGVKHKYGCKDRGEIIGAYALGYRNDRKYPIYVFAHLSEYKKSSNVWNQYTSAMILKVAEAMMLKRLFSISGLVTKEEIDEDYIDSNGDIKEVKAEAELLNNDLATLPQINLIKTQIVGSHLFKPETIKDKSILDLLESGMTKTKASEIISWWKGDSKKFIIGERLKRETIEKETKPAKKGKLEIKDKDAPFPVEDEVLAAEDMPE